MVALLAEGVDRNMHELNHSQSVYQSPSSRRAWIEISFCLLIVESVPVALLAEGVDRNEALAAEGGGGPCRPPRGGRG